MKRYLAFALALVLLAALTGCGAEVTPASEAQNTASAAPAATAAAVSDEDSINLYGKMQTALKSTPCTHQQIRARFVMTFTGETAESIGSLVNMTTTNTTDISLCLEPLAACTEISSVAEIVDETETSVSYMYTIPEDDAYISYTGSNGVWLKSDYTMTAAEVKTAASTVVFSDYVKLDSAQAEYQGVPAYLLKASLTGSELRSTLVDYFSDMGYDSADLSNASCDMQLWIDRETLLPIYQVLYFDGIGEPIEDAYYSTGIEVSLQSCVVEQEYLSFESAPEITLPEGVEAKAEAWARLSEDDPDNGDGSFTIREESYLVDLVPPQDYSVLEYDYNMLVLHTSRNAILRYSVVALDSSDSLTDQISEMMDSYSESGYEITRNSGDYQAAKIHYTTGYLSLRFDEENSTQYYAWSELGNDGTYKYYLLVELMDGYDSEGNPAEMESPSTNGDFHTCLEAAAPSWLMK